jgi:hypothetical protein
MKSVEKNNIRSNQQHEPSAKANLNDIPKNSQHGDASLKKKKRKPVKNIRQNEEDIMTVSDIQQGFLGYMTHHRWGKESNSPTITLNDMTPLCRQWVTKLSPILDMFDFDCQDIYNLVESCDYDESRIQASVDLIFKERGGHERGEWKVGRKRAGAAHKSNQVAKNSTTPTASNNKPARPVNTSASEKKHYTYPKNRNRNKKENHMDHKTSGGPTTFSTQSKKNNMRSMVVPSQVAPTQAAPTQAAPIQIAATQTGPTQIAPSQTVSTTTKSSETPVRVSKEVPPKPVSWASILVEKLAADKVKESDFPQEPVEKKESSSPAAAGVALKQTTPNAKPTVKDGYNKSEVKCGQITTANVEESSSNHLKSCVSATTLPVVHDPSRKTMKPFVRSDAIYTTIDENTKKNEVKSSDAKLLDNSSVIIFF